MFHQHRGLEVCELQEIQVSKSSSLVDAPSRHLLVITNSMKGGRTQSESPNHFTTESLPGADKKFRHTCKHCAQLGPGRQAQGAVRVVAAQRVPSTKQQSTSLGGRKFQRSVTSQRYWENFTIHTFVRRERRPRAEVTIMAPACIALLFVAIQRRVTMMVQACISHQCPEQCHRCLLHLCAQFSDTKVS